MTQAQTGIGITPAKAPDGSYWISITHALGGASFTWGLPVNDDTEKVIDQITSTMKDAVREARRQASGLVIASADDAHVTNIGHPNGNRATRRHPHMRRH